MSESPQNGPIPPEVNPLDSILLGSDLPVSEQVPPELVQELLEAPSGIFQEEDEGGNTVIIETDPATPPGTEIVFNDPSWLIAVGEEELEAGGQDATVFEGEGDGETV